jgi:antitoxin ParD1/3/4/toxin ParE1/3/4
MKRYRLTSRAKIELTNILEYLAERSPEVAIRMYDEPHEAMSKLAEMPGMGHKREDITGRSLLFWSVYSYVIIYRADRKPLEIVHIVHGARDLRTLLQDAP